MNTFPNLLYFLSLSVCDKDWGFGVISDISGNLENMDDSVLFDFFYFTHELGHSLGSSHTFDEEYDPPVDVCGECAIPGGNATVVGLPKQNSGTIMVRLICNDRSNTCDF